MVRHVSLPLLSRETYNELVYLTGPQSQRISITYPTLVLEHRNAEDYFRTVQEDTKKNKTAVLKFKQEDSTGPSASCRSAEARLETTYALTQHEGERNEDAEVYNSTIDDHFIRRLQLGALNAPLWRERNAIRRCDAVREANAHATETAVQRHPSTCSWNSTMIEQSLKFASTMQMSATIAKTL